MVPSNKNGIKYLKTDSGEEAAMDICAIESDTIPHILRLPPELLREVTGYLSWADRLRFSLVNRQFNQVSAMDLR